MIYHDSVFSGSLSTVVGWKKANLEKGQIASFLFDVQSDKNPFFEVFKVPKTKGIALDKVDGIIVVFQVFWIVLKLV